MSFLERKVQERSAKKEEEEESIILKITRFYHTSYRNSWKQEAEERIAREKRETKGNLGVEKKIHKRSERHRADFRDTGKHPLITRNEEFESRSSPFATISSSEIFLEATEFPRRFRACRARESAEKAARKENKGSPGQSGPGSAKNSPVFGETGIPGILSAGAPLRRLTHGATKAK